MIPSILRYIFIVIFGLLCTVIVAQDVATTNPVISLLSPQNNLMTTKSKVLFKGVVEHADTLYINGTEISISEDGKFYHRVDLTDKDTYNEFNLKAIRQY